MPDQVRHDGTASICEFINFDPWQAETGLSEKSQLTSRRVAHKNISVADRRFLDSHSIRFSSTGFHADASGASILLTLAQAEPATPSDLSFIFFSRLSRLLTIWTCWVVSQSSHRF
jgi:hypothetical protein